MKIKLPALVNFVLILAVVATGTYWVLQFISVRTPPEPVVAIATGDRVPRTQARDTAAIARLFGSASTASPTRIRLAGVIAEGGKGAGVALLSLDGQPAMAYRVGDPIDADLTLASVHADRVVILTAGGTQEVRMPEPAATEGIVPAR